MQDDEIFLEWCIQRMGPHLFEGCRFFFFFLCGKIFNTYIPFSANSNFSTHTLLYKMKEDWDVSTWKRVGFNVSFESPVAHFRCFSKEVWPLDKNKNTIFQKIFEYSPGGQKCKNWRFWANASIRNRFNSPQKFNLQLLSSLSFRFQEWLMYDMGVINIAYR